MAMSTTTRSAVTLIVTTFLFLLSPVVSQSDVVVMTSKGAVVGVRHDPNPATGVSYDAFLGVPYGRVTERFQAAVPVSPWSSPLVAQEDGPQCPQRRGPYSEDCLYLNIYSPTNSSDRLDKLAVIVFIQGGGYMSGNSSSRVYGPDWLVGQGVVLVTINYRLGALGFLTLGSKAAPGNQGLHDCVLALQWVREEISMFGGDPSQVTVMGASAGAVIAQTLYLSPYSTGLLARAISHSGSLLAGWSHVTPAEGAHRARQLAEALHCPTDNETSMLACLQAAPVQDIVINQEIYIPIEDKIRGNYLPFAPVLDSWKTAKQPFFNVSLDDLMDAAIQRDKQLLIGFNADDGDIVFADSFWNKTEKNLIYLAPKRLSQNRKAVVASKMKTHYFPDTPDLNKIKGLVRLYTHVMFSYPIIKMANALGPVTFGYVFAHEDSRGPPRAYVTKHGLTGAKHGDEMSYLFYRSDDPLLAGTCACATNNRDLAVRDSMVRWWAAFAKTGVPDKSWLTVAEGSYQLINERPATVTAASVEGQYYNFLMLIHSTPNSATTTTPLAIVIVLVLAAIVLTDRLF